MANTKTVEFSGTIESAFGNKLPVPVEYATSYEEFLTPAAVREGGKWPSDSDIVSYVNAEEKAKARAKAMTAALDAKFRETNNPLYRKLDESTADGAREALIKKAMKANPRLSREKAEKMADMMISAAE